MMNNNDQRLDALRGRFEVMSDEALEARFEALSEAYESLEAGEYTLYLERDPLNTRYGYMNVTYAYRYDLNDDDVDALEAVYIERDDKVMRLEGFEAGDLFNGLRALRFNDTLIQNALPALTPAQREFIMTGLITA